MSNFLKATGKSKFLFERAQNSLPSGTNRAPYYYSPYPLYMVKGKGCYVWDVDGNRYLDFANNMGPLILGHRDPRVVRAVSSQVQSFWCGGPTEVEIKLAETILKSYPMGDKVLFTASGSEAVMKLVRAFRASTGKKVIAVATGSFHGTADTLMPGAGVPNELAQLVVQFRYNDAESFKGILREFRNQLSAVLLEGVLGKAGSVPPEESFLHLVREETEKFGIPLLFDEVVTGFRLEKGGISERFRILPDGVALGKIIGGGFPIGAFLAPSDFMKQFQYSKVDFPLVGKANIRHAGTFNAHPVTMAAGLATVEALTPSTYTHLERLGNQVRGILHKLCEENDIPHTVTGIGSLFRLHFSKTLIKDYETAQTSDERLGRTFDFLMETRGVSLAPFHTSFCSTPMRKPELSIFEKAATESLREIKRLL